MLTSDEWVARGFKMERLSPGCCVLVKENPTNKFRYIYASDAYDSSCPPTDDGCVTLTYYEGEEGEPRQHVEVYSDKAMLLSVLNLFENALVA